MSYKTISLVVILTLGIIAGYIIFSRQTKITPSADSPTPIPTQIVIEEPTKALTTTAPNSQTTILNQIQGELATKYQKEPNEVEVTLSSQDDTHAKGMVSFKSEAGGGIWFATKINGDWTLVFDGNGIVSCQIANQYDFSTEMIPGCVEGTEFVDR